MKYLNIEWRHLEEDGKTCLRCAETGKSISKVIDRLAEELKPKGVEVTFTETKLSKDDISQSNLILFNDIPLEDVLSGALASLNCCSSCACLIGKEAYCRTIEYEGKVYEEIPEDIIRRAALKAISQ